MKNIFTVVGFIVIAKKAFELYREYSVMKRGKEQCSAHEHEHEHEHAQAKS